MLYASLHAAAAGRIPNSLRTLTGLEDLHLHHNELNGESQGNIFPCLALQQLSRRGGQDLPEHQLKMEYLHAMGLVVLTVFGVHRLLRML